MRYHDALRYLYQLVDYEKRPIERDSAREFKLERVESLLAQVGHPHKAYPTVHVAGTKGKGSVAAMLAEIAQAGGLRTGLYTSPHLHTFRDRMQVDRQPISRAAFVDLVAGIKPAVARVAGVTLFEVATALAFLHFAREHVDIAVIEVGLGGRLDATNVITPLVSVITSLSLDHTAILGATLAAIAREKGGIIKPGVPVVVAPQATEALDVLTALAAERQAALTVVGRDWTWISGGYTFAGQVVQVQHAAGAADFEGAYTVALLGNFQQENVTVAVVTAATLAQLGCAWANPASVRMALARVSWPGRMEVLRREPLVLVDCAHNPYSAGVLVDSLRTWFPGMNWTLIFGASRDKDIAGMLKQFLPHCTHVIVTLSHHPRAKETAELVEICAALGYTATVAANPRVALEVAQSRAGTTEGVLAAGSVFITADVREAWAAQEGVPLPLGDWVDEAW